MEGKGIGSLHLYDGELERGWFDKLTTNGWNGPIPFVVSLSKDHAPCGCGFEFGA